MKKIPSMTTLFLGMGIAAFLFAGCEQTTGPSGSGDKSSGESAKTKKDQNEDSLSDRPHSNPMQPAQKGPNQVVTLPGHMEDGTAPDSIVTLPGHEEAGTGPGCVGTIPPEDSLVSVPPFTPGGPVVTSDTPDGCLKDGPFSGEVVCHLPRQ